MYHTPIKYLKHEYYLAVSDNDDSVGGEVSDVTYDTATFPRDIFEGKYRYRRFEGQYIAFQIFQFTVIANCYIIIL